MLHEDYTDMIAQAQRKRPNYNPGAIRIELEPIILVIDGAAMVAALGACKAEFKGEHVGDEKEHKLLMAALEEYFSSPPKDMYEAVIAIRAYEMAVYYAFQSGAIKDITFKAYRDKVALHVSVGMALASVIVSMRGDDKEPDLSSVDMSQFDGIVATFKEKNNGRPH